MIPKMRSDTPDIVIDTNVLLAALRSSRLPLLKKVAALATETYLQERAERASATKFMAALAAVPDVLPDEFDREYETKEPRSE